MNGIVQAIRWMSDAERERHPRPDRVWDNWGYHGAEEGTNLILGENLSAFHLAYLEDRELEDGCAVMGY